MLNSFALLHVWQSLYVFQAYEVDSIIIKESGLQVILLPLCPVLSLLLKSKQKRVRNYFSLQQKKRFPYNTSDTKSVGFPLTLNNSDTKYPELVQTPQVRAQHHEPAPTSDAHHESHFVTCASAQSPINQGFLRSPPWVRQFARVVHRTQENSLLPVTGLL